MPNAHVRGPSIGLLLRYVYCVGLLLDGRYAGLSVTLKRAAACECYSLYIYFKCLPKTLLKKLGLGLADGKTFVAPLADKAQADSRPIQAQLIAFPLSTAKVHHRLELHNDIAELHISPHSKLPHFDRRLRISTLVIGHPTITI